MLFFFEKYAFDYDAKKYQIAPSGGHNGYYYDKTLEDVFVIIDPFDGSNMCAQVD